MIAMESTPSCSQVISNHDIPPHLIVLDVSGRKYQTQRSTLQAFPYFHDLLARWKSYSYRQEYGSCFVDADPNVFQYVLEFMRRPSRFPLFWTRQTGFDYALYSKLEAEADHFLLHDLRDWLRKKRYLDAVKTIIEVKALSEQNIRDPQNRRRCQPDMEVESFFGSYSGEKRYRSLCADHPEMTSGCHSCAELLQAHGPQYDDPSSKLTLVTRRIEFDGNVCV
ncbi:hypothetical protein NX059_011769 [Plenodomus lindquistii]|nr:hypothetical protein NX059_011769 [Plenodomus lindquistii]